MQQLFNKCAFLLDNSIVSNTNVCFNVINDYCMLGSIYIYINDILSSENTKLKKYIIDNSVQSDNMLKITNEHISIIVHNIGGIYEHYFVLLENISPKIITISHDVMLGCKLKNIQCELYSMGLENKLGFYNGNNKNPKNNQFKYDTDTKELSRYTENQWKIVSDIKIYNFSPINCKQKAYLDLLMDDNIKLVLCSGSAGSGKTFVACLSAIYDMLDNNKYSEMVVSRATIDIGDNSIGFLPGTKEEKMNPWIQPIKDNLDSILKQKYSNSKNQNNDENNIDNNDIDKNDIDKNDIGKNDIDSFIILSKKERKKIQKKFRKYNRSSKYNYSVPHDELTANSLIKSEKLKIECLSFFRGRTFNKTICIIDEAQNLTSHEIKTIITRIGDGSKLIMIGDIDQSDLKKKNSDFSDVINKMYGNDIVGVIHLDRTVRSDIASLAVKIL